MPRKPPPKHTQFKPGQSGNISGKPKNLLTGDKVMSIIGGYAMLTCAELQDVVDNPKTPVLDKAVANMLLLAANGDYTRLDFLLSRSIGKVKDQLEVSTVKPYIVERLSGATIELGAKPEKEGDG